MFKCIYKDHNGIENSFRMQCNNEQDVVDFFNLYYVGYFLVSVYNVI